MSNSSWQDCLKAELQHLRASDRPARIGLLGIGHELCGDDAVGVRVAGLIRARRHADDQLLAIEAGPAPENFTAVLRRFRPDLVILVDSALMDDEPGTVRWLNPQDAEGFSASTHTLPLDILVSYLTLELGCAVGLIGIQPQQTFADAPLTPRVRAAADDVACGLFNCLDAAAEAAAETMSS